MKLSRRHCTKSLQQTSRFSSEPGAPVALADPPSARLLWSGGYSIRAAMADRASEGAVPQPKVWVAPLGRRVSTEKSRIKFLDSPVN